MGAGRTPCVCDRTTLDLMRSTGRANIRVGCKVIETSEVRRHELNATSLTEAVR